MTPLGEQQISSKPGMSSKTLPKPFWKLSNSAVSFSSEKCPTIISPVGNTASPKIFSNSLNPFMAAPSPATTRRFSSPGLQDRIWFGSSRLKKKAPWCETNSVSQFLIVGVTFFPAKSHSWRAPKPATQFERHRLFGRCVETSVVGRFLCTDRACFTSHSQSALLGPNDWAAWQRTFKLLLDKDGKSIFESSKTISFCLSFEVFAHLNTASTATSSLETFKSSRCRIRWSCLAVNLRKSSLIVHWWKSFAICSSQANLKSGSPQITASCSNCSASWLSKVACKSDCTASARLGSPYAPANRSNSTASIEATSGSPP